MRIRNISAALFFVCFHAWFVGRQCGQWVPQALAAVIVIFLCAMLLLLPPSTQCNRMPCVIHSFIYNNLGATSSHLITTNTAVIIVIPTISLQSMLIKTGVAQDDK